VKAFWALGAVHVASAVIPHPAARIVNRVTKPLLMPALGHPLGRRTAPAVRVALAASAVGDTALMAPGPVGILGGVTGFGVAHLAYLTELTRLGRDAPRGLTGAIVAATTTVVAAGAAVLDRVLAGAGQRELTVPVVGYAGLCAAMAASAVRAGLTLGGRRGRCLVAGGLLFVISDSMVAAALFGPARWDAEGRLTAAIMITYLAAQALLVEGLSADS